MEWGMSNEQERKVLPWIFNQKENKKKTKRKQKENKKKTKENKNVSNHILEYDL